MADKDIIAEDEMAVRLTSDISGGLGIHEKGTVLRRLSSSAFMTLTDGGFGEKVKPGTSIGEAVDVTQPAPAPAPEPAPARRTK